MQEINQEKANLFMEKMIGILNSGSLALMTSVGHRTGLFDTMAKLPPSTIDDIAKSAELNQRYVREWLGAMVTSRIVEFDPTSNTYHLPHEHAAFLTRAASPNNLAVAHQFISVIGGVEDHIVECFRKGGGVPYSAYPRFHEAMAEQSGQTVVAGLLEHILPLVSGITESLEKGIDVLDIGCGSGLALIFLAKTFPNSRFTGYDFSDEGIAKANAEAKKSSLTNIEFKVKDVATLSEAERYDFITAFDAIHDQAKPASVLQEIYNALRADGIFLMQDIAGSSHVHEDIENPIAPFGYTVSCMHCMTVSLALGGEGLGTMWGKEKALEMLNEAGFKNIKIKQLPHDILNYYYIVKKN